MRPTGRLLLVLFVLLGLAAPAMAQAARQDYERALARERALAARRNPPAAEVRSVVAAYESIVRKYPRSGYSDNALWQGAGLSLELFERTGTDTDRRKGLWMLDLLLSQYPSSSLVPQARQRLAAVEKARLAAARPLKAAPASQGPARPARGAVRPPAKAEPVDAPRPAAPRGATDAAAAAVTPPAGTENAGLVEIRDIRRILLPEAVRVSIEFAGATTWTAERLDGPPRLFFDVERSTTSPALRDATVSYDDADIVREVRLGRRPGDVTRIVLDIEGADAYNVLSLDNPHRLVVDVRRRSGARPDLVPTAAEPARIVSPHGDLAEAAAAPHRPMAASRPPEAADAVPAVGGPLGNADSGTPLPARRTAPNTLPAPAAPEANSRGGFSLARQLGLGVSRIVIDPGHGGHDPGALGRRLTEAELVLDVSLRLEKLLLAQPGFEVLLTRRDDVFVPLEERTAIANRANADLFLSIHANASRNRNASGVETYFLNFALNPEAEAVAARENSASGQTMHNLPDIVKAIALNNKLDESRDLAKMVQTSMVRHLGPHNRDLKDLGVKQAPFVVLIGAGMPSVLAEISFVTHEREGQLLRTPTYRQKIAEALFDAVLKYQRSLKAVGTLAAQEE